VIQNKSKKLGITNFIRCQEKNLEGKTYAGNSLAVSQNPDFFTNDVLRLRGLARNLKAGLNLND
jgi:hypothetical protein